MTLKTKITLLVLPKGFMNPSTLQTLPTSEHCSPKKLATYFLELPMNQQNEPSQEYQEWLKDPKLQQEYNQWRLKDEIENLKKIDPNFQNTFNKIFGVDK